MRACPLSSTIFISAGDANKGLPLWGVIGMYRSLQQVASLARVKGCKMAPLVEKGHKDGMGPLSHYDDRA